AGMGGMEPHAGMGGMDPHAGMGGMDPHAGMGLPALEPPDPDRPVDRSRFLRGKIVAADAVASRVRPGAVLFLSVRPVEPVSGDVIGSPLAVDRLEIASLPVTFHLDGSKAMSAGTGFEGDVVIVARVDQDGDALSKEPGDVEGELRA